MQGTNASTLVYSAFLLVLLLLLISHPIHAAGTCSGYDLTVTAGFVDIYAITYPKVLATSDGGAVYAAMRNDNSNNNGNPRIVKVDSTGKFEWFSEQRPTGDVSGYAYHPTMMVEDTTDASNPYIFLAGRVSSEMGFVIKYSRTYGTHIVSALFKQSSSDTRIYPLLIDSTGVLVFGGYYGSTSSGWIGTMNKFTLAITKSSTVTTSYESTSHVMDLKEDVSAGNYVFAGKIGSNDYLWVGAVDKSSLVRQWEWEYTGSTLTDIRSLFLLSSGNYAVLYCATYCKITPAAGISTLVTLAGAWGMSYSTVSGLFAVVGYTSSATFAYYYDPVADCTYNSGAALGSMQFLFSGKSSSSADIWATGQLSVGPNYGVLVRISQASASTCSSGYTNYFNLACYQPVTSTTCFGLCATCLISSNINACATAASLANSYAVGLFAGRCSATGTHYNSVTKACATVTQTSCNGLCGGECLVANDATKCAHHCKGVAIEPYIDDSDLASNTCKCVTGYAYSVVDAKCEPCHVLCGSGGCGSPSDNTKCVDCASVAALSSSSPYVTCSCPTNTVLVGSVCPACSSYCSGCASPSDNIACLACASISGISKTSGSSASTYKCECPTGTVLSSAGTSCDACSQYCNGCTSPADNSKCSACASISGIVQSSGSSPYTCTCPSGTALSSAGTSCDACSSYCSGCIAPGDNTKCSACAAIANIYQSTGSSPYTCACPSGTAISSDGTSCDACSVYCNECTAPGDNTKCKSCAAISDISQSGSSPGPYTCACPTQTVLSGAACLACSPYCDECALPTDNTVCKSCTAISGIAKSSGSLSSTFTCGCPSGTALSGASCDPCSTYCDSCTVPGDNTECLSCALITSISKSGVGPTYTCECPIDTVLSGAACLPCSPYCSGCTLPSDNTACLACASVTGVVHTGSTCECPSGSALSSGACLPCSPLCQDCAAPNDNHECQDCITSAVKSGSAAPYTCECPENTVLSRTVCAQCHVLCDGCYAGNDNAMCVDCSGAANVEKVEPSTCQCVAPTVYYLGMCVYQSGCHVLCSGYCLAQTDATKCVSGCQLTSSVASTTTSVTNVYHCSCATGTVFTGSVCVPILSSGCSTLCSDGCIAENDPTFCIGCVSQRNVIVSSLTGGVIQNCSCAAGTVLVGSICAYQKGCSPYCASGCTVQGDSSACVDCAVGTVSSPSTDLNVTCACPDSAPVYTANACVSVVSPCFPLCGGSCVTANDPTKCAYNCSHAESVVVKARAGQVLTCGCANGTKLNAKYECVPDIDCGLLCDHCLDSGTCLACSDGDGMILSTGKCICQTGYVQLSSERAATTCVKKSSSTSTALQYFGYVFRSHYGVEARSSSQS